MIQEQKIFCEKHDDYLIQMVCFDYSSQENYRMCKKCKYQFQKQVADNQHPYYWINQQNFQETFLSKNGPTKETLLSNIERPIQQYLKEYQNSLTSILRKLPYLFEEATDTLKTFKKLVNEQSLSLKIKQLKDHYNKQKIIIKQDLNNLIYNQLNQVEKYFFSYDILENQDLFQLPSNDEILTNLDVSNLIRKFERIYKDKYLLVNEDQIKEHMNKKLQKKEELITSISKIKENYEKIIHQIETKIDEQKSQMINRVKNKCLILQQNCQNFQRFIHQFEQMNDIELSNLSKQQLTNICKLEELENILEQQAKNLLFEQSRICHVGRIDVQISLEEVQQYFCINYIPIAKINKSEVILPSEIKVPMPEQVVPLKQLPFQIDLSLYFKTNLFDYNTEQNEKEIRYTENSKPSKWECIKLKSKGLYNLILHLDKGAMKFREIKLLNNLEVDKQKPINISCPEFKYKGTINNKLQYHGQGVLVKEDIISSGNWQNGMLNGFGKIEKQVGVQREKIYEGNFLNDKFHGKGIRYYSFNYQYLYVSFRFHGNFVDGLREGTGTIKQLTKHGLVIVETNDWKQDFPESGKCSIF